VGSILLKVLLFQFFVAAIVIFVLKKILNHQLEELAVKKFEYLKLDADEEKLEALTLIASGTIPLAIQKKVEHLCTKKFGHPLKLILKTDKNLKGGLIIQLKKTVIDYSLIGRLKEGGVIRSK
jgi:F0F1-type ATP synthase delta subunit